MKKKKHAQEYAPDQVAERKQLLVSQAKRLKFEIWPEDDRRLHLSKKPRYGTTKADAVRLRDIAEWYLLVQNSFLIRLHHSWISDKAWDYFEEARSYWDKREYLSNAQRSLMEAGKWWVDRISPHAGGAMDQVEIQEAGVSADNIRDSLYACNFNNCAYYFPSSQCEMVWQFYPDAIPYLGRDLVGWDLWGAQVIRACPLTFTEALDNDNFIVIAFLMPLTWR